MPYSVDGPIHHLGPDMTGKRGKLEVLKEKEVSQSASCENLNKVNNDPEKKSSDDYKRTDESPTSAIDADEIIMRSRGNCGQAEKESATGNSQSAEKFFSLRSLHKQVNKLELPKKSPQLTQTPAATTTATPHSENVVSEALALPLEVDPPFLPPTHQRSLATRPRPATGSADGGAAAEKDQTGDVLPECEETKMDKLLVAPAPESASASTSTPCSHSEVSTPAEDPLEPPLSKDVFPLAKSALAPAKGCQVVPPPRSLDDDNFLLLAECARVVRDTIALRGVQVCALQTPISGSFADF